jgi:hypothetical protein
VSNQYQYAQVYTDEGEVNFAELFLLLCHRADDLRRAGFSEKRVAELLAQETTDAVEISAKHGPVLTAETIQHLYGKPTTTATGGGR